MSRSLTARLRRFWLDVHLWVGVGLMIVLIPLSLTGSALVWRSGLDHAFYPERYAVSGPTAALPAASYAAAAQAAFQGRAVLTQVRLPQVPGDPVVAVGRIDGPPGPGGRPRTLNAWIDPPTGRLLTTAEIATGATMTIHRLHGSLLIPGMGRKIVGWLGWAMFVSAATGLWLWWPRHGFLKGLRWRRGASQLFNLHHTVGFWLCVPLAVLSLTGVYISFPQTARALFGVTDAGPRPPAPGRADPRFAPPLAEPQTTADAAVAAALATAPGAQITALNTPTAGEHPAWRIELAGGRQVRVDDATGKAKAARPGPGGREGARDPISAWMRKVHDGGDTPLLWRAIITLAGIAPTVLGLSGLVIWLRRRARRKALLTPLPHASA